MTDVLDAVSGFVWGPFLLIPLLVGTGLWLTVILRGLQFRTLGQSLWLALVTRTEPGAEGDVSHFQALMTALAATVGTGNIAGVATAIALGGPGALFWMWMTGLVGMATKYSEALLSVKYRETDERGHMSGGPMHFLAKGVQNRRLGRMLGGAFAVFAALAAFGIGNGVQSQVVGQALEGTFGFEPRLTQVVLAVLVGAVILGGIRSIARFASVLVPGMIAIYVAGALVILALHWAEIPRALAAVFAGAFGADAIGGGLLGAGIAQALRFGIARGIFSNESGLGSGGIAAAAATTREPVRQALVSMTQTFIDTILICSLTGLVILTAFVKDVELAGDVDAERVRAVAERIQARQLDPLEAGFEARVALEMPEDALTARVARWQLANGSEWTTLAFRNSLGDFGGLIVAVGLALFAFSTLIGWSYYGEKSLQYLFGIGIVVPYRVVFAAMVVVGPWWFDESVWVVSDIMNGLMALPNLVGLLLLSGVVVAETRSYFDRAR